MAERNFYNTFLTYGLTSKEKNFFIENERNFPEFRKFVDKDLEELYWIDCEDFSDILAIPAFMILIDFMELEEDEIVAFKECFKGSETLILSLRDDPCIEDLNYYPNFDLVRNELDRLQLLRTMMIMEKRNYMLSSDDIKITLDDSYVAVDISFENTAVIYEAAKILGGKIDTDERLVTKNLSELKEWIGETPVIVWTRELSHNRKSYNMLDVSDKLIDLYLYSATEYPALTLFQDIDDRLKYFFHDCDEENDCLKIAYLFLIVLLEREKYNNIAF